MEQQKEAAAIFDLFVVDFFRLFLSFLHSAPRKPISPSSFGWPSMCLHGRVMRGRGLQSATATNTRGEAYTTV